MLVAMLLISISAWTAISNYMFYDSADRRCLDSYEEIAPQNVDFLSEEKESLVKGEVTSFPIGIRCSWPTSQGIVWTDDGWSRTFVVYGGLLAAGAGLAFAIRR